MEIERRRTPRYNFGAIAEIADLETRNELVAVTRDLSLSGCFISTSTPFPQATEVRVRFVSSGTEFSALGKVTGNVTREGMGIAFTEITPENLTVLEKWLSLGTLRTPSPQSSRERRQDE